MKGNKAECEVETSKQHIDSEDQVVITDTVRSLRSLFEKGAPSRGDDSRAAQQRKSSDNNNYSIAGRMVPRKTPSTADKQASSVDRTPQQVNGDQQITPGQRRSHETAEDGVDSSPHAMVDLLEKFRKLELEEAKMRNDNKRRAVRKSTVDGYNQRSASLDRKGKLTYEKPTQNSKTTRLKPIEVHSQVQQKLNPAKELDTRGSGIARTDSSQLKQTDICGCGWMESEFSGEYSVSIDAIKMSLGYIPKKEVFSSEQEEFPSAGTVQTLLSQWKCLENKTLQKKKRVRFGVDSSWLPEYQEKKRTVSYNDQLKPCLKLSSAPTMSKVDDINNNNDIRSVEEKKQSMKSKGDQEANRPSTEVTAVRQVLSADVSSAEELREEFPPPANTKILLAKFKALQDQSVR